MANKERISRRFNELEAQAKAIPILGSDNKYASHGPFHAWASSALNLVEGVFGQRSPHSERLRIELGRIQGNYAWDRQFEVIRGIFLGAKADFDGGYLFDVEAVLAGELFGDFVSAAKAALADGNHTVAAVLACAALEDALKRYALSKNLDVNGKSMTEVVNALKSKGLVTGAQKSLLDSMPRVRNYAMHAEWNMLTPQDAGSVIGFTEQFLLTHFSDG